MAALTKSGLTILVFVLWLPPALPGRAIDNPDAVDRVAAFEARCEQYEAEIQQRAQSTADFALAYGDYEHFLDQQLNEAYSSLTTRLSGESKAALVNSQRRWIQFRDAEFRFVAANWTIENFGSSSALSRGAYRANLVRSRVTELLSYLRNYPENAH